MTPQLAQTALQFLARVDLKGSETMALNEVIQGLLAIAQSTNTNVRPDLLERMPPK